MAKDSKTIGVMIRFWNMEPGEVQPGHAWAAGTIYVQANDAHARSRVVRLSRSTGWPRFHSSWRKRWPSTESRSISVSQPPSSTRARRAAPGRAAAGLARASDLSMRSSTVLARWPCEGPLSRSRCRGERVLDAGHHAAQMRVL